MATVFKRGGRKAKGTYLFSFTDHRGLRKTRSARTTDLEAARRIAAKCEADAALRRDGVVDPRMDKLAQQSRRSIEDHLGDYEAKLRAAGRNEQYIVDTLAMIRAVIGAAGFTAAIDISADGVNHYATNLKEGKSARRVHAYLTAVKGFTRWLTAAGKLSVDPLAGVKKPDPNSNRSMRRRILLPNEWQWLRSVTLADRAERYGMSAAERVLLYAVAIQTGLRANELRSLSRGSLFLADPQPYVTCKAGSTKNRKDARQYIKPDLADELRQHVATKAPGAAVFAMPGKQRRAAMLRTDLAAARLAWLKAVKHDSEQYQRREQSDFLVAVNHEGEVLDFHSLRHTCGAWLAMSGATPRPSKQSCVIPPSS